MTVGHPSIPDRVPAPVLFLGSGFTQYCGAALAIGLFAVIPAASVAWWRLAVSAVVLLAWRRPWRRKSVSVFWRIFGWLRKRHPRLNKHTLVRRHLPDWKTSDEGIDLFRPETVVIVRYRYRGSKIPTPWSSATPTRPASPAA